MSEIKDQLQEIGFGRVEGEYKGVKLEFHPLNTEESLVFFSLFMQGNTNAFLTKFKKEIEEYISHSLGKPKEWVKKYAESPGFVMFCINKMLEASDYDYFILNSLELQDKMMALVQKLPKTVKEKAEKEIEKYEEAQEAGSEELSVPSVSQQGEASTQSSEAEQLEKQLPSTRKYRKRKQKT